MSEQKPIRSDDLADVQCDRCKTLHPLIQRVADALACMDRLNNTNRPCPACGVKGQWVVSRREERQGEEDQR